MNKKAIRKIIDTYGQTFYEEIGIKLTDSPSALFQWFYASNLFSARISSEIAVKAAQNFIAAGYTSSNKMAESTWDQRVKILNDANYTRYQERTSTFFGDLAGKLNERYQGDLRKLRDEANRDPENIRKALGQFKGEGNVGIDIFFREVQLIWNELYPFADQKAIKAAGKLNLSQDPETLAKNLSKKNFVRLIAALVRIDLNHDYDLNKQIDQKDASGKKYSRQELYEKAREQDISGRSKMSKQKLKEALKL